MLQSVQRIKYVTCEETGGGLTNLKIMLPYLGNSSSGDRQGTDGIPRGSETHTQSSVAFILFVHMPQHDQGEFLL